MTAAGLDAWWEMTTPLMHISCNDGVIQLSPLSSYAVHEIVRPDQSRTFCTPSLAVCPTHCSQLDLNPANLEATTEAEWILNSLSSLKMAFSMMSRLRHHYLLSCKYWWNFLKQFFSHPECRAVTRIFFWTEASHSFPSPPFPSLPLSPLPSPPSPPFLPLPFPLEVGPSLRLGSLGERLRSPSGAAKRVLMHFRHTF